MIKTAHVANQSSGSILCPLEFVQLVCRKAVQETIAIVGSIKMLFRSSKITQSTLLQTTLES